MDHWIIGPCRLVFQGRHVRTGVKRGDPTLIKGGSNSKSWIISSLVHVVVGTEVPSSMLTTMPTEILI